MIPQSFWVSLMGWGHLGWLPTNAALTWQLTKWGTWIIFSGNLSGTQGRGRVSPLHSCDHQAQEVGAGWDSHWCGPNSLGDFRQIPLRPPLGGSGCAGHLPQLSPSCSSCKHGVPEPGMPPTLYGQIPGHLAWDGWSLYLVKSCQRVPGTGPRR